MQCNHDHIHSILSFLAEIGLAYKLTDINEDTFLPGVKLLNGTLLIDLERLLYPGDILHEAGHLACMPAEIRAEMSGMLEDVDLHRGGEMMAIAWSYAACIFLNIDPTVVFHENGYKSGGKAIIAGFENGGNMGIPLLQWYHMTYDATQAEKHDTKPFPYMQSWICVKSPHLA